MKKVNEALAKAKKDVAEACEHDNVLDEASGGLDPDKCFAQEIYDDAYEAYTLAVIRLVKEKLSNHLTTKDKAG